MSADASGANVRSYGLPDRKAMLVLYAPVFMLLLLVVLAALIAHIPVSSLTRDIASIAQVHPLLGVLSNIGVLLWCATAAICFFGSSLLRQQHLHSVARFLRWAGLMTVVLLLDDLFMIHEYIAPVHFHVDEKVVLASYAAAAGLYLLTHRRLILAANYLLLVAAMLLFSASMLVDLADGRGWWRLAEDGCKILGIASWLGYHAGVARHWVAQANELRAPAAEACESLAAVATEGMHRPAPASGR